MQKRTDSSNFFKFLNELPEQIKNTPALFKEISFPTLPENLQNIMVLGMGGSAIAGDIMQKFLEKDLKFPFLVNRNYHLPAFIGKNSLIISCSYSGNTEETLSATQEAIQRGATVIGITTGGKLEEMAVSNHFPIIKIPSGYPPRQAIGYMFFPLLTLLEKLGLVKVADADIRETIIILESIRERNDPVSQMDKSFCNHIAKSLYMRIPVIYTASSLLEPVTVRWRNQFNENSKVLAFSNQFPELNHNEIMGWEMGSELQNCFSIILLRDESEYERNRLRLEITRDIWRKQKTPIFEIFSEGKSSLARVFSQIYLGDWVSYYLALLYDKDPIKIGSIDLLKKKLSEK
ncbi:MAG: bifunctional phosphoglucose/phosphomannose isomerase [Calditrichia bacterium]